METVGNIAGPLLTYEVLTAFFLKATFLGLMLLGFRRVSPWMHTPVGFEMRDGVAHATDWFQIIFTAKPKT